MVNAFEKINTEISDLFPEGSGLEKTHDVLFEDFDWRLRISPELKITWGDMVLRIDEVRHDQFKHLTDEQTLYYFPGVLCGLTIASPENVPPIAYNYLLRLKRVADIIPRTYSEVQVANLRKLIDELAITREPFDDLEMSWLARRGLASTDPFKR